MYNNIQAVIHLCQLCVMIYKSSMQSALEVHEGASHLDLRRGKASRRKLTFDLLTTLVLREEGCGKLFQRGNSIHKELETN